MNQLVRGLVVVALLVALAFEAHRHYPWIPFLKPARPASQTPAKSATPPPTAPPARRRVDVSSRTDAPVTSHAPPTFTDAATPSAESPAAQAPVPEHTVTVFLTNGGVASGELVSRSAERLTLRWEWGEVSFTAAEISRVEDGKTGATGAGDDGVWLPWQDEHVKAQWPHRHDVVARLMNGSVLDAEIIAVLPDVLVLSHALGQGGRAEQRVPRSQLECLLFRPIRAPSTQTKEAQLRETFPEMRWHEEGLFTIITDSTMPTVKRYWSVIRELSTEWYLAFHPILKGRRAAAHQYVVIFDDWADYIEHALTDGVPGWAAVGYFTPEQEVLYAFNMLGERFSALLHEAFLGKARGLIDGAVGQYKTSLDERYHIFLEGQAVEIKAKFERADTVVRAGFRELTEETLRHELTHSLFHAWGLQTITLSKIAPAGLEEAKKKREFLASSDPEHRRQLLLELLNPQARPPIDFGAWNAWAVEGLAGYMERLPPGEPLPSRLAQFQEAVRERQVLPLEFLDTFRMGSFPGIAPRATQYAYAQSWALVHFLMSRHREAFLGYLEMCRNLSDPGRELAWLLRATGRDLRQLDLEFQEYMRGFPAQDPPWLVQYDALREIFSGF